MPRVKKIDGLPDDIKRELDQRIVSSGFSGYVELEQWLADNGLKIGKSAIHRHGQVLKEQYEDAMKSARELLALTRASGELGESGAEISRHSAVILQTEVINASLALRNEDDPEKHAKLLARLTKAQADLGRMVISADKWKLELSEKISNKLKSLEDQAAPGKSGFDMATLKRVREEIYGIVA